MTETDKSFVYGKLQICPMGREVYIDGQETELTRMEFDVLYFMASNPNMAFTKEQIYEAVSKGDYAGGAYIIRDIIYHLRTKLKIANIRTLYGYGCKFSTDDDMDDSKCHNTSMEKISRLFFIYIIQIFMV